MAFHLFFFCVSLPSVALRFLKKNFFFTFSTGFPIQFGLFLIKDLDREFAHTNDIDTSKLDAQNDTIFTQRREKEEEEELIGLEITLRLKVPKFWVKLIYRLMSTKS